MKFPGINLSNYARGNSFDTKDQLALANAVGLADRMTLQTFGNVAQSKINDDSLLKQQKMSKAAGLAVDGMMRTPNALSNIAGAGMDIFSALSKGGGGGSSTSGFGPTSFASDITTNSGIGDMFSSGGAWKGIL